MISAYGGGLLNSWDIIVRNNTSKVAGFKVLMWISTVHHTQTIYGCAVAKYFYIGAVFNVSHSSYGLDSDFTVYVSDYNEPHLFLKTLVHYYNMKTSRTSFMMKLFHNRSSHDIVSLCARHLYQEIILRIYVVCLEYFGLRDRKSVV